ncbi:ATP synthase mitochondrial F1 complex assembly factor 1 [Leptinotarsa decemlineata]|uniref:ATP synthase mitochondrial F1 complex assembly factor 1 n=1 Tax=Leptinotarsa decemlineata TaxID=7539 RepID=UPI000C25442A|nr:ATP synthase mitochondrial F1 complex assembly factor 1 [Leptinotarsa decemlineata]
MKMHLTTLLRTVLFKGTFKIPRKTITTSSKMMQEVVEDLKKNNPYFDKYSSKIAKLGKEDPTEFKARVEGLGKKKLQKVELINERPYSNLLNPKKNIVEPSLVKKEALDKIMKIDLIKDKSSVEIETIWKQYHLQKDNCIAATIPSADFDKLYQNGKNYPTFVFALPRSQGYEFIMCQFSSNTVHFTPLLYYQVHKENAPECLTITHFDEFKESKEIVLMRGEFDKNIINAVEAQCLANQLQLYYIQEDPNKRKLLEVFTKKPDEFNHTDLISQIETLSLN